MRCELCGEEPPCRDYVACVASCDIVSCLASYVLQVTFQVALRGASILWLCHVVLRAELHLVLPDVFRIVFSVF